VARESPKLLPRAIAHFVNFIEGRRKNGRNGSNGRMSEGKKEEGREEGRGEREKARIKKDLVI
jgi:hypothetical protein